MKPRPKEKLCICSPCKRYVSASENPLQERACNKTLTSPPETHYSFVISWLSHKSCFSTPQYFIRQYNLPRWYTSMLKAITKSQYVINWRCLKMTHNGRLSRKLGWNNKSSDTVRLLTNVLCNPTNYLFH